MERKVKLASGSRKVNHKNNRHAIPHTQTSSTANFENVRSQGVKRKYEDDSNGDESFLKRRHITAYKESMNGAARRLMQIKKGFESSQKKGETSHTSSATKTSYTITPSPIQSRLLKYKRTTNDTSYKNYSSLSYHERERSSSITPQKQDTTQSMDWTAMDDVTAMENIYEVRKEINYNRKLSMSDLLESKDETITNESNKKVYIVVDTNIFLLNIDLLTRVKTMKFSNFGSVIIIVPWMVLQELDYMKETIANKSIARNARKAVNYINELLTKRDPNFKGQTVMEASKVNLSSNNSDDGILHCCLQLVEENKLVILLSNDNNLRNKCLVNNIQAYHSNDLIHNLRHLKVVPVENNKKKIEKIKILLSNMLTYILEKELRKAYGNIWLAVVKTNPPYTTEEGLGLLCRYWKPVFSLAMQKQAILKIENFLMFLRKNSVDENLSLQDFNNLIENALTLCIYLKNGYFKYEPILSECINNIKTCAQEETLKT